MPFINNYLDHLPDNSSAFDSISAGVGLGFLSSWAAKNFLINYGLTVTISP